MTLARYLGGLALLTTFVGPLAWGAVRARRRLLPGWSGPPARLVEIVLVLSLLVVVAEGMGTVGGFRPVLMAMACVVAGLGVGLLARDPDVEAEATPPAPSSSRSAVVLGVGATALVAARWASWATPAVTSGTIEYDSLHYHLPFAARFVQEGWVTHLHPTTPEWPSMFHPANAELLHGYGMLGFGRDILSPFLNFGWLALALLAAWCVGRPQGKGPLTLATVTLVLSTPLVTLTQAGSAQTDVAVVALLLAAVALIVQPGPPLPAWAVAGLAAGLGVGTKLTLLLPVAALTLAAVGLAPAGGRRRVGVVWVAALAATGAFWYLRNLVHAGSPLPALDVGIGPLRLPSVPFAIVDRFAFSVAHYATDLDVWRDAFRPGLHRALGPGWALVLALAGMGLVAMLLGPRLRGLGAVGLLSVLAYAVTPGTALGHEGEPAFFFMANLRYLAPALALGLALLPLAPLPAGRAGRAEWWTVGAGVVVALALTQTATDLPAWPGRHRLVGAAAALAVLAGAALWAAGWTRRAVALRRPALAAVVGAGLVLAVGVGHLAQRRYLDRRYAGDPVAAWADTVHDRRVAIAGFDRQYALYGADLSNRVQYVAHQSPRGDFVPYTRCADFQIALRAGRYDYVVFNPGLAYPGEDHHRDWASVDPGATEALRAGATVVYRFDWRRPAGGCPP